MDRLALYLSVISGASVAGVLMIVFFALGWSAWGAIPLAIVIGAATAWPSSRMVSRSIRRKDPEWHPDDKPSDAGPEPKREAPDA